MDLQFIDAPDLPVQPIVLVSVGEDITFYAYGEA